LVSSGVVQDTGTFSLRPLHSYRKKGGRKPQSPEKQGNIRHEQRLPQELTQNIKQKQPVFACNLLLYGIFSKSAC